METDYPLNNCQRAHRPRDVFISDLFTGCNPLLKLLSAPMGKWSQFPPVIASIKVKRDVEVNVRDGTHLMCSVYMACDGKGKPGPYPTVLLRTPYNRKYLGTVCSIFASRGFHVVIQDCRGTGESGGTTELLRHERNDGADTVAWIKAQPFTQGNKRVAMWGMSFLGMCAYGALSGGAKLDAVMPIVSSSNVHSLLRPGGNPAVNGDGGGFAVSLMVRWHFMTIGVTPSTPFKEFSLRNTPNVLLRSTSDAFNGPLCDVDKSIIRAHARETAAKQKRRYVSPSQRAPSSVAGTAIADHPLLRGGTYEDREALASTSTSTTTTTPLGKMIEDHIRSSHDSAFWQLRTFKFSSLQCTPAELANIGTRVPTATGNDESTQCAFTPPPVHLVGGWYDMFLPGLMADYDTFRASELALAASTPFPPPPGAAQQRVLLTVGPWAHFDQGSLVTAMREAVWRWGHSLAGRPLAPAGMERNGGGHGSGGGFAASAVGTVLAETVGLNPTSRPAALCEDPRDVAGRLHAAPYRPYRRAVMIYVLGLQKAGRVYDPASGRASRWAEFDTFPPAGTASISLPLCDNGRIAADGMAPAMVAAMRAVPCVGASVASTVLPPPPAGHFGAAACGSSRYVYDPYSPAPTVRGADFSPVAGKCDLARLETRSDVAVWTTDLLAAPGCVGSGYTSAPLPDGVTRRGGVTLIGPVSVTLSFAIDADTIDFVARLSYVPPPGTVVPLFDVPSGKKKTTAPTDPKADALAGVAASITTAAAPHAHLPQSIYVCEGYRRVILNDDLPPSEQYSMLPDGRRAATVTIPLAATALHVPHGTRLRVSVTSSSFPRYARNYGTTRVDQWRGAPGCDAGPVRAGVPSALEGGEAAAAAIRAQGLQVAAAAAAAGHAIARSVRVEIMHGASFVTIPIAPSVIVV